MKYNYQDSAVCFLYYREAALAMMENEMAFRSMWRGHGEMNIPKSHQHYPTGEVN